MTRTCDTSVLVPALLAWHPDHEACRSALRSVRDVPAHVLVECYSVITRLPAPHRVSPADAGAVLEALPLKPVALPAARHVTLVPECSRLGIRGGAVYDALVARTAAHHSLELVTRDRRARATYDQLGVRYVLV
ncbi:MAG TPA: type II toxin-antitoxin system VapC family toxin [Nocardioides sp.]|nr:type II toxin-antitoxin system VapC family toxin [Nocardioides sp.]